MKAVASIMNTSSGGPDARRRLVVCSLLLVGFVVILLRLFFLQVIQGPELANKARRQHLKVITLNSSRGAIYDRQGRALALNLDVPSVYATPASIEDPAETARQLATVLGLSPWEVEERLRMKRDFVWVKRKVTHPQAQVIRSLSLKGIELLLEEKRFYPKGTLLSHVLGFAGIDSQGLEGLERGYEPYLRGKDRKVILQRDGFGRTIIPRGRGEDSVLSGHTIWLTIDEVVQYIAERALDAAVAKTGARGGTIIVLDPQTGGVLGWALRPTFDPNRFRAATPDLWRNRAVTDPYEPGSTLKIILAAAALEEGIVEPGTLIYAGDGQMPVSGTIIHDHEKAGWLTFSQAMERSSNVAAVKTSLALGKEQLYRYLRAFGFGERTEIDLPGESKGILKRPENWDERTLASIAIGQEIGVTPLQLVSAAAAIANQGWLMKPYVVQEIRDGQGELDWVRKPQVHRRPISQKTAAILTELLVNAVREGTGKRARIPGYRVAGKTGTAQKVDPMTGGYSSTRLIGSFVGFVPAENPRLVLLVMIDEPQGPAWGSLVAAPVFREVAEQVLRYLQVPPDGAEKMTVAAA